MTFFFVVSNKSICIYKLCSLRITHYFHFVAHFILSCLSCITLSLFSTTPNTFNGRIIAVHPDAWYIPWLWFLGIWYSGLLQLIIADLSHISHHRYLITSLWWYMSHRCRDECRNIFKNVCFHAKCITAH